MSVTKADNVTHSQDKRRLWQVDVTDLEDSSSSETIDDDRQTAHDPHSALLKSTEADKVKPSLQKKRNLQTRKTVGWEVFFYYLQISCSDVR